MGLKHFIEEFHPEILEEYDRYLNSKTLPPVGAIVMPLHSGFGFSSRLKVIAHAKKGDIDNTFNVTYGDNFIVLKGGDGEYLVRPENWWKEIKIIK